MSLADLQQLIDDLRAAPRIAMVPGPTGPVEIRATVDGDLDIRGIYHEDDVLGLMRATPDARRVVMTALALRRALQTLARRQQETRRSRPMKRRSREDPHRRTNEIWERSTRS